MIKVLISAPYMHREKKKIEKFMTDKNFSWDVTWIPVKERLEEEELLNIIPGHDGIICGDDRITENVINIATKLRVIVKWGTGIDSINKEYAEKKGIAVYRSPNAFTVPVSETTLAYMLAFCRGVITNDKILKNGDWDKPQGFTLSEKTVGLIGFGNIGRAVAKRLQAFGAKVIANDIKKIDCEVVESLNVKMVGLNKIFEESDIISLHCDLNPTSQQILDKEAFKKMKKNPLIINTARGPLIEEESLIDALKKRDVAGAGLDVFFYEPLPKESPLRKMENVLLASHNSNSSPVFWDNVHVNSLVMLDEGLRN